MCCCCTRVLYTNAHLIPHLSYEVGIVLIERRSKKVSSLPVVTHEYMAELGSGRKSACIQAWERKGTQRELAWTPCFNVCLHFAAQALHLV